MADVYSEHADENFPGAHQRTRPGQAPGERIHDITTDAYGRTVIDKPANSAILAGQKARLERERLRKERQAQQGDASPSTSPFTVLILLAIFVPLLGHFLTGSYDYNLGPTVKKQAWNLWAHPANPLGPKEKVFTLSQLKKYDGSNPDLPIYLAVDGQVYDVSANPRIYGKGGAYNTMAGIDASRSFITGCFATHRTHDLRGIPVDQLKALDNWKDFFSKSDKYFRVGRVQLPDIDPSSPIPKDCREDGSDAKEAPAHHAEKYKNRPKTQGSQPHGKADKPKAHSWQ